MSFGSSEEDSAVSPSVISGDTSSNRLQLISDRLSSSILVLLSVTLPGDSLALGVEHMVAGPGGLYVSLFFRRQGEDGLLLLLAVLSPDLPRKTCTGREWSWMKIQVKVDVSKTFSLEKNQWSYSVSVETYPKQRKARFDWLLRLLCFGCPMPV